MNAPAEAHNYVCPNCNTVADGNYCPQCGQETHLHKDTFWGLLSHFVAHYFHYDSKFWKTLKALVFHPGKLTLEYRAKHRMRYIPPISLYIFVSVFFFLIYSLHIPKMMGKHVKTAAADTLVQQNTSEDEDETTENEAAINELTNVKTHYNFIDGLINTIARQAKTVNKSPEAFKESYAHSIPKIFFLMIPLLALLLKICFLRNKEHYYVDHAVFALHYHCFCFMAMCLWALNPFKNIERWLVAIIVLLIAFYFYKSLRNVYKVSRWRAFWTWLFCTFGYFIFFIFAFVADVVIVFFLA